MAVTCVIHVTVVTYVTDETLMTGSTDNTTGIPATQQQLSFSDHLTRMEKAKLLQRWMVGGGGGWTVSRLSVTVSSIPAQPPTALL